jgi:hypothetical protein
MEMSSQFYTPATLLLVKDFAVPVTKKAVQAVDPDWK